MTDAAKKITTDAPNLGALPEWDLDDLYPGPDSTALKRDLDAAEDKAKAFRASYEDKLATLNGAALGRPWPSTR